MKTKSLKAKYKHSKSINDYIKQRIIINKNGCWIWQKSTDRGGYGQCIDCKWHKLHGKSRAYQLSYIEYVGNIPEGMLVCHTCDVPSCCNPEHLFLGTHLDNNKDMCLKDRDIRLLGEQNPASKLTEEDIKYILTYKGHRVATKLAKELNVSFSLVAMILRREIWTHVKV